MVDIKLDKTIQVHEDHVALHTGRFVFTSKVTKDRDINGCIASCVEKATNGKLHGVIIHDNRQSAKTN